MYRFHLAIAALLLFFYAYTQAPAATNFAEPAIDAHRVELVVIEVPGCIYCGIFRRDVLPSYEASPRARTVPIRFLDLNDKAADRLQLSAPVTVVPTVLVLEGNQEIGRIDGYTGPENFFHAINAALAGID